jgi:hypothetical protein
MKYSIIVCYRNREEHLKKFVPAIRKHFEGKEHEIIIVEQTDNFKFQRGSLLNAGVVYNKKPIATAVATGDILIFHDVDYLPTEEVVYWPEDVQAHVFRPIKRVQFLNEDMTIRPDADTPPGYRHFINSVDDDFFGGVTCFKRDAFLRINGFNPNYTGWGLEDADLRERIKEGSLKVKRSDSNMFHALYHTDSNPGLNDEGFKLNQQFFSKWRFFTKYGVNTQRYEHCYENHIKSEQWGVDKWIDVSRCLIGDSISELCGTLESVEKLYKDAPEIHSTIWHSFKELVNRTPELKAHRDWVVYNQWGYGNRALHWMWNLLIDNAPPKFSMLEIGVFKGQTLSLVALLAKLYNKDVQIFGITPLTGAGDKYNQHPDINYEEAIATIFAQFGLDAHNLNLIEGLSTNQRMIDIATQCGPYSLVYIDGCHDYEVVVSDIKNYGEMVEFGGYLIVDDASNDLKIPNGLIRLDWRGLPDVTNAVNHVLDIDKRFKLVFAVGHNKVYQRISNA